MLASSLLTFPPVENLNALEKANDGGTIWAYMSAQGTGARKNNPLSIVGKKSLLI